MTTATSTRNELLRTARANGARMRMSTRVQQRTGRPAAPPHLAGQVAWLLTSPSRTGEALLRVATRYATTGRVLLAVDDTATDAERLLHAAQFVTGIDVLTLDALVDTATLAEAAADWVGTRRPDVGIVVLPDNLVPGADPATSSAALAALTELAAAHQLLVVVVGPDR